MNNDNYTSLELSKKLHEAGCYLENDYLWASVWVKDRCKNPQGVESGQYQWQLIPKNTRKLYYDNFPAYNLLWDVCVRYAKDFFGGWYMVATHQRAGQNPITPCEYVLCCLQMNQKAKAELYIERHCIFLNKKT